MGLLDSVLGSAVNAALGGGQGGKSPLADILGGLTGGGGQAPGQAGGDILSAVLGMVQQQGGLEGVLGVLKQNGLGEHVDSWVGTGANKAVDSQQLVNALGSSQIGQLAAKLGIDPSTATAHLSKLLPEVVNQLTPGGKVSANSGDMLQQALAALAGGGR